MSQVDAVSNETAISQDKNGTKSSGQTSDVFDRILEEEKRKIIVPLSIPQLQSLTLTPSISETKLDASVNKVRDAHETSNDTKKDVPQAAQTVHRSSDKTEKSEERSSAAQAEKTVKAQEIKAVTNASNKIFMGQIELDGEFYGNMKIAKDGISSLKGVDLSDLVSQIQDKIKMMKDNGKLELTIQLKPDDMGSVLLSVTSNKGVLSIMIYADKLARQSLDENLADLEISLKRANLNIGSLSVQADGHKKNNNGEYLSELLYNDRQES